MGNTKARVVASLWEIWTSLWASRAADLTSTVW